MAWGNLKSSRLLNWIFESHRQAAWAPWLVFFSAAAMTASGAYASHPELDMPTHFVGGIAITYFFSVSISRSEDLVGPIPTAIQRVLAISLTSTASIVWEFMEFLVDVNLGTRMNNGVSDTLCDFLFGLLGAIFLVLLESVGVIRRGRNQSA